MLRTVLLVHIASAVAFGYSTKIIGGTEASSGQFPAVVSLQDAATNSHFCGGALISDRIIISAGHCLYENDNPADTVVYVGSINNTHGGTRYELSRVIVHEKFDSIFNLNDISLLQTSTPVEFSDTVQPIGLPTFGQAVPDGTTVNAVGWGSIGYPNLNYPEILHFVEIGVVGNDKCKTRLDALIKYTHICVGGVDGTGLCYGDSGSPLVLGNTTVGIVSWGHPCAIGYPDVFTRVSAFVNWIEKHKNALEAEY